MIQGGLRGLFQIVVQEIATMLESSSEICKIFPIKETSYLSGGVWRPVRESNPCRRREREGTYRNSKELGGMDSTLPHLADSRERLLDL